MRTLAITAVITALLLALAAPASAQVLRYGGSAQGGIAITGNTLGLSGGAGTNGPTTNGSIATFISLDESLQDGSFPAGTTGNWRQGGSAAWLELPGHAVVLHAELIWGGSWWAGYENVEEFLDVPVTLMTPRGSLSVSPDPATASTREVWSPSNFWARYYTRSADVTAAVQAGQRGSYAVQGVPATQDHSVKDLNAAGWTLLVAYHTPQEPSRNLSIFVDGSWIDEDMTVDINVAGFCTPPSGEVTGSIFVSALEGDAVFTGDSLQIGREGIFSALEGPFNPHDNFFASQINNVYGERDYSGTFSDRNHDPVNGVNTAGGRQGWDITAVPISSTDGHLSNAQTQATVRAVTTGDSFFFAAVGFVIDENAPEFRADQPPVFSPEAIQVGETTQVTLYIENIGNADADSLSLNLPIPAEFSLVPGSFTVNGVARPAVDATALEEGVDLGALPLTGSLAIGLSLRLDSAPGDSPRIPLRPSWEYTWRTCPGEPAVTARAYAPYGELDTGLLESTVTTVPDPGTTLIPHDTILFELQAFNRGSSEVAGATLVLRHSPALLPVEGSATENGDAVNLDGLFERPRFVQGALTPETLLAGGSYALDLEFELRAHTDPEVWIEAVIDPDGDGPLPAELVRRTFPVNLDADGDGVPNVAEDLNGNGDLRDDDTDGDGIPNYLDPDDDGDGVPTIEDNCPLHFNPGQEDRDGNGIGDACDDEPAEEPNDGSGDGSTDTGDGTGDGEDDTPHDGSGDGSGDDGPTLGDRPVPDRGDGGDDDDGRGVRLSGGCCSTAGEHQQTQGTLFGLLLLGVLLGLRRQSGGV